MAEGVTETAITSLTPFSETTIDGVIQQLEFKPEVIYSEERAYINTYEQPFWHFVEASSEALTETDGNDAAEAYRRGVYIMHDVFRRQGSWKPGVLPTITVDL